MSVGILWVLFAIGLMIICLPGEEDIRRIIKEVLEEAEQDKKANK